MKECELPFVEKQKKIYFRRQHPKSYQRYRSLTQLIDFAYLDIKSFKFKIRALVTAFLFLYVGKLWKVFNKKVILKLFTHCPFYAVYFNTSYNGYFNRFLIQTCDISLGALLPAL